MRLSLRALSTLAGLALVASTVSATTVLPVQPSAVVDRAEFIFTGRVVHREFVSSSDGKYPFTFVTFEILETFKGRVHGEEITLRLDGGDLPDARGSVEVVGMPTFEVGDESLLFVAGNGEWGCPLVGWWQGRLDLVAHPATGKRILVDHKGAPVESLRGRGQAWKTADVRYDAAEKRLTDAEPSSQLLWQDGVTIIETEPPAKAYDYVGVEAEHVFDQLRSLIGQRRFLESFVVEQVVKSANPYDIPETVQFTAAGQ